jgi:hypothetical protein
MVNYSYGPVYQLAGIASGDISSTS